MEKTVTIDIEDAENGAIFTEYDEEGGKGWKRDSIVSSIASNVAR